MAQAFAVAKQSDASAFKIHFFLQATRAFVAILLLLQKVQPLKAKLKNPPQRK
jgi:hypothetical protein